MEKKLNCVIFLHPFQLYYSSLSSSKYTVVSICNVENSYGLLGSNFSEYFLNRNIRIKPLYFKNL